MCIKANVRHGDLYRLRGKKDEKDGRGPPRRSHEGAIFMDLLTESQRARLLANGIARSRDASIDAYPVVKLITLDAHATWLLSELAPDGDTAYGLIDLGLGAPELGHVRLSDLAAIRGPNNIPVRQDLHFTARCTLSEYARQATEDGSIND
jgi:hypothetical protein